MLGDPSALKCNIFVETDGCLFPVASVPELMWKEAGTVPGDWIAGLLGALLRGLRRSVGDCLVCPFPKTYCFERL